MNNTLVNGLALLALVANTVQPHGVTELSRMAGLPKSHVHRLLQSLVEARFLEKDAHGRYRISVGALRLGRELLRSYPIRRAALPELMRLVGEERHLSFVLAAPFGHEAISIAHITPDGNLRDHPDTLGSVLRAHSSASGKLFLAQLPVAQLTEVLAELEFSRLGPNTHLDAASLRAELRQIRNRGYSISNRENGWSTVGVAVPVRNPEGVVISALGASGQSDVLTLQRAEKLVPVLQDSARRIERNHEQMECEIAQEGEHRGTNRSQSQ